MKSLKQMRQTYGDLIDSCAEKHGLDPALVGGVVWRESRGNPKAVSRCGARGLMQLMPATARRFGVSNSFDPRQNVNAGCRYLAWLLRRFGDVRLAVAGYNAGEGNVEKYGRKIPPFKETQAYVPAVLRHQKEYQAVIDAETAPEPEAPAFLPAEKKRPRRSLRDWLFNRWGR